MRIRPPEICALLLAAATLASAQPLAPKLRIPRVQHAPRIEDFLAGHPSVEAAAVHDFRQREPHDGDSASQPTAAYLSYDATRLYIVFVCQDAPGATRAHMVKREDIGGQDTVGVYLDTFQDRQRAYLFETNAFGVQRDSIFTEGQKTDSSFDTVWSSQGRLTARG